MRINNQRIYLSVFLQFTITHKRTFSPTFPLVSLINSSLSDVNEVSCDQLSHLFLFILEVETFFLSESPNLIL